MPGLYDARALVARLRLGPDRTEEDIAAQGDALETAILQIEDDVAASYREETGFERLDSILSSGLNWGRIAVTVLAVIAIITENLIRVDDVMESPKPAECSGCSVSCWPSWPRHSSRNCGLKLRTRCFDIS